MPFDLTRWLHDTITIATISSFSAGVPVFGAQSTLAARVELNTGTLISRDGTEARFSHKVATLVQLPVDARVWMPGANTADANAAMRPIESKFANFLSGAVGYYLTFF